MDAPGADAEGPAADEIAAFAEAGRKLCAGPCDFMRSVNDVADLPEFGLPEVAFAGRSNVGKSSLINALLGRKGLARTSNTPGRTQSLNYFDLGGRMILVDLPGYGYAQAPKKLVDSWTGLIFTYLRGRPSLRRALLLIDGRHGAKPNDIDAMNLLDKAAVGYQAVLTKADKVKPGPLAERKAALAATLARHPAAYPEILATSSATAAGLDRLRAHLAAIAAIG